MNIFNMYFFFLNGIVVYIEEDRDKGVFFKSY